MLFIPATLISFVFQQLCLIIRAWAVTFLVLPDAKVFNMDSCILFKRDSEKHAIFVSRHAVPDSARCIQYGTCTYNCPIGIEVPVPCLAQL